MNAVGHTPFHKIKHSTNICHHINALTIMSLHKICGRCNSHVATKIMTGIVKDKFVVFYFGVWCLTPLLTIFQLYRGG